MESHLWFLETLHNNSLVFTISIPRFVDMYILWILYSFRIEWDSTSLYSDEWLGRWWLMKLSPWPHLTYFRNYLENFNTAFRRNVYFMNPLFIPHRMSPNKSIFWRIVWEMVTNDVIATLGPHGRGPRGLKIWTRIFLVMFVPSQPKKAKKQS